MALESLGVLAIVVAVLVANIPAVVQQWRADRPGVIKTLWLMGAYAIYVALGIAGLLLLVPAAPEPGSEVKALLLTGAMVAWILYGALTLMRAVPRYREPPGWLMRFGIADIVLLAALVGCLAGYLRL